MNLFTQDSILINISMTLFDEKIDLIRGLQCGTQ